MSRHSLTAYDVATGAVVDTFKTLMGLKAANTAGHRGRLRKLVIGGAGGTPQDKQVSVRVSKTDNTADGTGTAATVKNLDAADIASVMACKTNYTAEPTTVDSQHFIEFGMNARGTVALEWAPNDGPLWGINESLVIQASPGEATAVTLTVSIEWDE